MIQSRIWQIFPWCCRSEKRDIDSAAIRIVGYGMSREALSHAIPDDLKFHPTCKLEYVLNSARMARRSDSFLQSVSVKHRVRKMVALVKLTKITKDDVEKQQPVAASNGRAVKPDRESNNGTLRFRALSGPSVPFTSKDRS